MSAIAAERPVPSLKGPLTYSVLFHAILGALLIYSGFTHRGPSWGGPGGSVSIGVVGNVPAVPLPRPDLVSPNRVVDNTRGLYKTEPAPEIKTPPPPDAIPIQKFKLKPPPRPKEKPKGFETPPPPKYRSRPSKVLENRTPPPPNAIPYGSGGAPDVPYSSNSFNMGAGKATQGGLAFGSNGANGDFSSRFAWYVQAVQRKVSSNWLQATIDPNISVAPRVVVTFDILRDGSVVNAQVTRSSGNYSVDTSALRAVENSSPLNPLPSGYSGSRVSVDFWFDFHR